VSAPTPVEAGLLKSAELALDKEAARLKTSDRYEARLQILEATSALIGGFDLQTYHSQFNISIQSSATMLHQMGSTVSSAIAGLPIHPALALSALAREPLSVQDRRAAGAHHTDFRLATLIGRYAAELNTSRRAIVDPACGAGILLAATAIATGSKDRRKMARWLAEKVLAADVSAAALRGARLSLASLTSDIGAIKQMTSRWFTGDSLLRPMADWVSIADEGFGVVVANPPWEKLKVHRHEFERAAGSDRHYGQAHETCISAGYLAERNGIQAYARALADRYLLTGGEIDLFAVFTELLIDLAGADGGIAALLPAGLIRSKSTGRLRAKLTTSFPQLRITIIDNKARFFSIDTRFKFLAVAGNKGPVRKDAEILLTHCDADDRQCRETRPAIIPVTTLKALRPDLTIPEVRTEDQWRLFKRMARNGTRWDTDSSPWAPEFRREVDMTRERRCFRDHGGAEAFPVVEGRMVHQHRFGAKTYLSGSGRRARWETTPLGGARMKPQFWIAAKDLPRGIADRASIVRAGFCDIAGQTNERSMMAAIVPAGVVCGNKVPTVTFPHLPGEGALNVWCGMVNSFAFDWLLRRVLTTTVNYFLLQSIPLPPISPASLPGRRISAAGRKLRELDVSAADPHTAWKMAELRRSIDLICFNAYGISGEDAGLILQDFSSLDRSQPSLAGERRSTVTRDFLLAKMEHSGQSKAAIRFEAARALGATPYIASQNGEDEVTFDAVASG
jgi:hypothetical protein